MVFLFCLPFTKYDALVHCYIVRSFLSSILPRRWLERPTLAAVMLPQFVSLDTSSLWLSSETVFQCASRTLRFLRDSTTSFLRTSHSFCLVAVAAPHGGQTHGKMRPPWFCDIQRTLILSEAYGTEFESSIVWKSPQ